MAAKQPVKKAKKPAKAVKSSKTSTGRGNMTAAQYSAFRTAQASVARTQAFRASRIKTAVKVTALSGQAAHKARLSALAANAVHRTYLQTVRQKQLRSIRLSTSARLFKAQAIATQKQFAAAGEAIHAHVNRMQTLTTAQATQVQANYARKVRRKIVKPVATPKTAKARTGRTPYSPVAQAAGRAAAARVPASKTRKAAGDRQGTLADTQWITAGNDLGSGNCVAVAIANHCLLHTGARVTDKQVNYLDSLFRKFDVALYNMWFWKYWEDSGVRIADYRQVRPDEVKLGMIVGFEVVVNGKRRNHCGVLMPGNKVVSWGEVVPLESEVDEAWEITWTTKRP